MTSTKTSTKPAKSFTRTIDGATVHYRRTEKGYCYMGTARIKAAEFEQAEIDAMREEKERQEAQREARREKAARAKAAIERSEDPSREEYEERKAEMNVIEIDGVEWANDYFNGKVYRDGVECTRAEFNRAVGIGAGKDGKPARKPRKSKDVAFEHEGVTLTAKQADFLRELDFAGDATLGSAEGGWWTDLICDEIGGQFAGNPMAVGAMISTLCEKGLGTRSKEQRETAKGRTRKVTSFTLTAQGREVWFAMGLR